MQALACPFRWGRALAWVKKPTKEGGMVGPKMGSGDAGDANGLELHYLHFLWLYIYIERYNFIDNCGKKHVF